MLSILQSSKHLAHFSHPGAQVYSVGSWVLSVIYLATLGLQIILALGNRPKWVRLTSGGMPAEQLTELVNRGERFTYTLCFFIFGGCAIWLFLNTVREIEGELSHNDQSLTRLPQIYLTVKAFCPISDMLDEADAAGKSSFSVFISGTFGPIFAGLAGT